jgi:predicted amidohydrolase
MRLGLSYDLDFPELLRLKRVQAFLVGAAWPGANAKLLEVLARAAENQAYLLLASRADAGSPTLFVAPDGCVLGRRKGPSWPSPTGVSSRPTGRSAPSCGTAGRRPIG